MERQLDTCGKACGHISEPSVSMGGGVYTITKYCTNDNMDGALSAGNTFQDLPRLCEIVDNNEYYI